MTERTAYRLKMSDVCRDGRHQLCETKMTEPYGFPPCECLCHVEGYHLHPEDLKLWKPK